VLALLAGRASAQPLPGDWIVTAFSGAGGSLEYGSPGGTTLTSILLTSPVASGQNLAAMDRNNVDILSSLIPDRGMGWLPSPILMVSPAGTAATLATSLQPPNAADLDQDGSVILAGGYSSGTPTLYTLLRLDRTSGLLTTLTSFSTTPNGMTIDQDNGDYLVVLFSPGNLLRVNRGNLTITTIAANLGSLSGVEFEPRTGTYIVARFNLGVLRVTPGGVVTTIASPVGSNNAAKVDDETGEILVVNSASTLTHLTAGGTVIQSRNYGGSRNFSGVELYASRKVAGSGTLSGGSVYTVSFSFPRSGGQNYVAAMSLSQRPGIPLPDGRIINLAIDPLFVLSLGGIPGITTGFAGVLDGAGGASGTIALPAGFPAGLRVFISAVAVNPSLPSGLETGNTLGATTN
jgi:hypothetical protein